MKSTGLQPGKKISVRKNGRIKIAFLKLNSGKGSSLYVYSVIKSPLEYSRSRRQWRYLFVASLCYYINLLSEIRAAIMADNRTDRGVDYVLSRRSLRAEVGVGKLGRGESSLYPSEDHFWDNTHKFFTSNNSVSCENVSVCHF